ncbi:SUMF1/EgtB/PvdO family nonheme iron enzyme [Curvivirga sp.]|uniref:SUMF1/EgtB/PvdO family nonheme iron enzyme n=1 Tax=Curvivirga sp. TaxID=2856848 RepID=UPI003B5C708B
MLSVFRFLILAYAIIGAASLSWAKKNEEGVAVIIGNKSYSDRIPEVSYAHRDADAMRYYILNVLGYAEENVIDLRDATKSQLESAFGNSNSHKGQIWQYIDPAGTSDVTIYYSGHGVPGSDKRGYLLPSDANPDTAEINGYPIDLLYENLGKLNTRSVTILLDACFSGDSGGGMLIRNASPVFMESEVPETSGENMTVITAASGTQLASWDQNAQHGLFTHHLLDALYGDADDNTDGQITALEVKSYLDKKMTRAARRNYRREQDASLSGEVSAVLGFQIDGVFASRPSLDTQGTADSTPIPIEIDVEEVSKHLFATKNANIRNYPSIQGDKIGQFKKGELVVVTGKAGEWYRVAIANSTDLGYVYSNLLGEKHAQVSDFESIQECDECPEMVKLPKGSFVMGSDNGAEDEAPAHKVTIDYDFAVSRSEITVGQFSQFVSETDYHAGATCHVSENGKWKEVSFSWVYPNFVQDRDHPVVCMNWNDAQAYVEWLSKKTGRDYRLLSEAEWEYAAKGGMKGKFWFDNIAMLQCTYINGAADETEEENRLQECSDEFKYTAPVYYMPTNPFGLFAMNGNVWEWVQDCNTDNYQNAPSNGKADESHGCDQRALRGGGFLNSGDALSNINRGSINPDRRDFDTGFRIALSLN